MLQHAAFSVPRYDDGYCLDDNARALLLMALVEDAGTDEPGRGARARVALPRVRAATRSTRRRRGSATSCPTRRQWPEPAARRTATAARVWALGTVVGRSSDPGRQSLAGELFHAALPAVADFTSPRAWAYALLGIDEYLRAFQGDSSVEARAQPTLAERLLDLYRADRVAPTGRGSRTGSPTANARLSQALIVSGARMEQRRDASRPGLRVARRGWSASSASADGYFAPDRLATASTTAAATQARVRPAAGRGVRDGLGLSRRRSA